jgi:hypothetical protein
MRRGRPSDCHGNVGRLWIRRKGRIEIATGYALSDDGLWRSHSWGFEADHVIETTEARELYFGILLAPARAARFAIANDGR